MASSLAPTIGVGRRVIRERGARVPPPDLWLNLLCATPVPKVIDYILLYPPPYQPQFKGPPDTHNVYFVLLYLLESSGTGRS